MPAQQSLEDVLAEVESLRGDLGAEIVVQEEKWDWIGNDDISYTRGVPNYHEDYTMVQPRIAHPNTQKQESARQQLQQVHDSSEWYSVKYLTGRALGKSPAELDSMVDICLGGLLEKVLLPRTRQVVVGNHLETFINECNQFGEEITQTVTDYASEIITENIEPIRNATQDFIELLRISKNPKLKQSLMNAYYDYNKTYEASEVIIQLLKFPEIEFDKKVLKKFYNDESIYPGNRVCLRDLGQRLGYSSLRIWTDEHPVLGFMGVIAAAGMVAAIGHTIYQYFQR